MHHLESSNYARVLNSKVITSGGNELEVMHSHVLSHLMTYYCSSVLSQVRHKVCFIIREEALDGVFKSILNTPFKYSDKWILRVIRLSHLERLNMSLFSSGGNWKWIASNTLRLNFAKKFFLVGLKETPLISYFICTSIQIWTFILCCRIRHSSRCEQHLKRCYWLKPYCMFVLAWLYQSNFQGRLTTS